MGEWQELQGYAPLINIARLFAKEHGTVYLHSGGFKCCAKASYLGLFPAKTFCLANTSYRCKREKNIYYLGNENPWDLLSHHLDFQTSIFPQWMGYLSYEMGAFTFENDILPHHPPSLPLAYFVKPSLVIKVFGGKLFYAFHGPLKKRLKAFLNNPTLSQLIALAPKACQPLSLYFSSRENLCPHSYSQSFQKIQKHLKQGDIYQVNFSQPFIFKGKGDAFDLFFALVKKNPAPFSAYLNFSSFQIVSSSPERFLLKQGNYLETRPIKGTFPRGKSKEEDQKNKSLLKNSKKDQAELMMITDLMRNDLAKISDPGSVRVKSLRKLESYSNVFHALSIIEGKAKKGLSALLALRKVFPGGSITGCPKKRAMELIYQLESQAREVYTGSIGYFSGNQDFDFNIAIRTLICFPDHVKASFGGGVVIDSQLEQEKQEILAKGASIFEVVQGKI